MLYKMFFNLKICFTVLRNFSHEKLNCLTVIQKQKVFIFEL